jgi:hypothetical protein
MGGARRGFLPARFESVGIFYTYLPAPIPMKGKSTARVFSARKANTLNPLHILVDDGWQQGCGVRVEGCQKILQFSSQEETALGASY